MRKRILNLRATPWRDDVDDYELRKQKLRDLSCLPRIAPDVARAFLIAHCTQRPGQAIDDRSRAALCEALGLQPDADNNAIYSAIEKTFKPKPMVARMLRSTFTKRIINGC